jgi:multiple sugar transport system ATP-binding protein
MNELEIKDLVKHYGSNAVIQNVSFTVSEGEFFVLLGPSGGGKSTLLRLICGLEQPDSGNIILSNRDITRLPSRERNVGMVFQDYGLYPHMDVYQNIAYGLEARGTPRNEVDRRVRQSAEKLGITPLIKRIIVDLSGGEQQRVALARALAKEADLYLFDEPLSNLDPKLRSQARRDIMMVHREKHKPSVYVTHDQTEALAIGDRIGIIAQGRMQQVGVADDLIRYPANMYVAGFIGTPAMGLVRASLLCEGQFLDYRVQAKGINLKLPRKWTKILDTYKKKEVVLGIRPNAMAVEGTPSSFTISEENILTGAIIDIQPLIGETVVSLNVSEDIQLSAIFQEVSESLKPGDMLRVGIDLGEIRLFDPDTQEALIEK